MSLAGESWVVVVEDNPDHAELVISALGDAAPQMRICHAGDGEEALRLLRSQMANQAGSRAPFPTMVLLDLRLPKIDGIDVLREIKGSAETRCIPVVVLTTSDARSDMDRAYQSHANSYIVKPLGFNDLRATVAQVLSYWSGCNRLP